MRRREFLWASVACAFAGCQTLPRRVLVPVPPEQVAEWNRGGIETRNPADAEPVARALNPQQWLVTSYRQGQRVVAVQAFSFRSKASAFELGQKWRRGAGATSFQHGNVFVSCSAPGESTAALLEFARQLEGQWFREDPR